MRLLGSSFHNTIIHEIMFVACLFWGRSFVGKTYRALLAMWQPVLLYFLEWFLFEKLASLSCLRRLWEVSGHLLWVLARWAYFFEKENGAPTSYVMLNNGVTSPLSLSCYVEFLLCWRREYEEREWCLSLAKRWPYRKYYKTIISNITYICLALSAQSFMNLINSH
jgi:hypothetical protein